MKLHKSLRRSTSVLFVSLWFLGAAEAGSNACQDLVAPLHNQVNSVKDQGGMWSLYEKRPGLDGNSGLALKVDSKILGLMFTLDYLCKTLEGIPFSDIAEYVVSNVKEKGREGFIKENMALGNTRKEVTAWADFAEFSMSNRNRKWILPKLKNQCNRPQAPLGSMWIYSGGNIPIRRCSPNQKPSSRIRNSSTRPTPISNKPIMKIPRSPILPSWRTVAIRCDGVNAPGMFLEYADSSSTSKMWKLCLNALAGR